MLIAVFSWVQPAALRLGQAALSGKTLIEMGYSNVKNVGGIGDWEKNNGPMDK